MLGASQMTQGKASSTPGLKGAMKKAGITQGELAERMGVHIITVSRWVRGEIEPPISTLKEIAALLDCTVQELLGLDTFAMGGCRIISVQEKDGKKIITLEVG